MICRRSLNKKMLEYLGLTTSSSRCFHCYWTALLVPLAPQLRRITNGDVMTHPCTLVVMMSTSNFCCFLVAAGEINESFPGALNWLMMTSLSGLVKVKTKHMQRPGRKYGKIRAAPLLCRRPKRFSISPMKRSQEQKSVLLFGGQIETAGS